MVRRLEAEGSVSTPDDPTFCECYDPVPIENCLTCLWRRLRAVDKARGRLAALARTLADGDWPPSAVECRKLIDELEAA